MTLAFAPEEYASRLRRLHDMMSAGGLEQVLVFGQDHMYYLTGYDQIGYSYYQTLIVRNDADAFTYLCREVDAHIIRETSIVDDVQVWLDDSDNDPTEITLGLMRQAGNLSGKRIGIDMQTHGLLPSFYEGLRRQLSNVELVDVSDQLMDLRLVKSPAEVACMREAGRLFDIGLRAGFASLAVGKRECDVHAEVMRAIYVAGGEFPAVAPPIESGPRTLHQTHGAALRRVLQAGDPFTLEIGACFRRYHAVGVRSAALLRASPTQQRLHAILQEALTSGLAAVRPGVRSAEVAQAMHEVFLHHGIDRRTRHCGYGTGIGYPPTWIDSLRIKLSDPHVLEPGTTFMLHSILADWDAGLAVALGDPILVTESGAEPLTRISRELIITNR